MKSTFSFAVVGALLLSGCAGAPPALPSGRAAYDVIPTSAPNAAPASYIIGPLDLLNIVVFQEPDLSFTGTSSSPSIQVDAVGNLPFPLIGTVRASGRTPRELGDEIAARLNAKYLVDPQVLVIVASSVSQKVIVEGSVNQPGVYEIKGPTTLLEALAMAQSPTDVAKLDEVVVFRNVGDQRMGAVFNVDDIRDGRAPDPEIHGNDIVVVGFSAVKGAFRDFLRASPLIGAFSRF